VAGTLPLELYPARETGTPFELVACQRLCLVDGVARIRAFLGRPSAVTLWQGDRGDRLQMVWCYGDEWLDCSSRSLLRRTAFEERLPLISRVSAKRGVGAFPWIADDETLGVLEVIGQLPQLRLVRPALELLTSQLGVLTRSASEGAELRREVEALEQAPRLGIDLARAHTPRQAVEAAVGFLAQRFGGPIAGWCRSERAFRLVSAEGLGGAREDLEDAMSTISRPDSNEAAAEARQVFEMIAGEHAAMYSADAALILAGSRNDLVGRTLAIVGSLLDEVLPPVTRAELEEHPEQLDMGIAVAAHELRAPLLGVRATLEVIGSRQRADDPHVAMVRSSVRELDQTLGTTDALLAWAVGGRIPERRPTDLVALVADAVGSCTVGMAGPSVVIDAPGHVTADVDPGFVRIAIANLVRNGLSYRRPGTVVRVSVRDEGDRACVSVRDDGPRIPDGERANVFEPFYRGEAVRHQSRTGSGLGLFITRRVVEAHDGSIRVDTDDKGTTFSVELPTGRRRWRSVS
jgi:signal transduction histidine kinase